MPQNQQNTGHVCFIGRHIFLYNFDDRNGKTATLNEAACIGSSATPPSE
jgi:hypothetical protein